MSARCRACGAEIVWATTVNGKAQPFDAAPTKATTLSAVAPAEHPELVDREGPFAKTIDVYTPHHATCPHWPKRSDR